MRAVLIIIVTITTIACGRSAQGPLGDASTDAGPTLCDQSQTTTRVAALDLTLRSETTLALDGAGARCDQAIRALTGPGRPPELEDLDTTGFTSACHHDPVLDRETVRLLLPRSGPDLVLMPPQNALVHVDRDNMVRFLAGTFLPKSAPRPGACNDAPTVAASIPGRALPYLRYQSQKDQQCGIVGPAEYTIAADDEVVIGDEGLYAKQSTPADGTWTVHRVREVEVLLTPSHVDAQLLYSDANCCHLDSLEHCVGKRFFIDVFTGEVVDVMGRCITC